LVEKAPFHQIYLAGMGAFLFQPAMMVRSNKHKSEHMMHDAREAFKQRGGWRFHDRDPQTSPVYI
jgi:hypothetical protein